MPTNGLDVFRSLMSSATRPTSHGGTDITQKEVQSALRAIVFRGNMSVDKDDFAAAKKFFESDTFDKHATHLAVETAAEFISAFDGRWPDRVQTTTYEPGKLYSLSRANLPKPPAGHAWDLRGADGSRPGNVLAVLTAMDVGNGYLEGKMYSIDRSNMPALPQGFGWALNGLSPTTPGHVLATVVRG